jgi:hypothetical protein
MLIVSRAISGIGGASILSMVKKCIELRLIISLIMHADL